MTICTILFDWAIEDSHDVELYVYTDELIAREIFAAFVQDEKNPENSWCGKFFTPTGKFNKKYADQVDYTETSELFHLKQFNTPNYSTIKLAKHFVK